MIFKTMYVPKAFQFDVHEEKIAFMRRYPFATMVTVSEGLPLATHLPFVVEEGRAKLLLASHVAAGNGQLRCIEENTSLVIFSEPHAYISPSHYDRLESVPTWNYVAIHAYGRCRIVKETAAKLALLEKMIHVYDQGYLEQWNSLSDRFKAGMLNGLVAFTLEVTELQGQQKLSQNKTAAERTRIMEQLEGSSVAAERDLAMYIKETLT